MEPWFRRHARHLRYARERGPFGFFSYACAIVSEKLLLPRPLSFALSYAQIEPTTVCNLSCPSCVGSVWSVPRKHMSLPDFQVIIDRLPPVRTLVLQGVGEPLLVPHLTEMIRMAAAKAQTISIVTNGHRLSPQAMAALEEAGCAELVVSAESVCDTSPSPIHAPEDTRHALSRVAEGLGSGLLRGSMRVAAAVSLAPSSVESIVPTLEAIRSAGIRHVRVDYANEVTRNPGGEGWYQGKPLVGPADAARTLERAAPVLASRGLALTLGWRLRADLARTGWSPASPLLREALGSRKPGQCRLPWTGVYVTLDGKVTPCCHVPDPAVLSFGSLLEQSFAQVVRGQAATEFRRLLRDGRPAAFCATCPCFVLRRPRPA